MTVCFASRLQRRRWQQANSERQCLAAEVPVPDEEHHALEFMRSFFPAVVQKFILGILTGVVLRVLFQQEPTLKAHPRPLLAIVACNPDADTVLYCTTLDSTKPYYTILYHTLLYYIRCKTCCNITCRDKA